MRVLTAEVDLASRVVLEAALKKWGYEVVQANDGEAAWQLLAADNAPPIAILDLLMPGLSGVEVCARVRSQGKELAPYLLLLTTKEQKADAAFCLEADADDYLTKPYDLVELAARLRVAKRSLIQQRDLLAARKTVEYQAGHDVASGALNRGAIIGALKAALQPGATISIGLIALDEHRAIQERHGAEGAESAMRSLVQAVRAETASALIGRYAPDELLILLPNTTLAGGVDVADRLRSAVSPGAFTAAVGMTSALTLSVGLATWDGLVGTEILLRRADMALHAARTTGDAIDVFSGGNEQAVRAG